MSELLDDTNKEETNLLTVSLKITGSVRPTNKLQIQEKKRKQNCMCSLCGYEIVLNVLEIFQIKNTTQIVQTLVARKVIKMLAPKQMNQRLLAQVKQKIPQKYFFNEICQIIFSVYQENKMTKSV